MAAQTGGPLTHTSLNHKTDHRKAHDQVLFIANSQQVLSCITKNTKVQWDSSSMWTRMVSSFKVVFVLAGF